MRPQELFALLAEQKRQPKASDAKVPDHRGTLPGASPCCGKTEGT